MSNALAIATVTETLRSLLEERIKAVDANSVVTTQPPDKALAGSNRLNLFLYHVAPNAALRNNAELPGIARPGSVAAPPLALDLFYLLSAYGVGDAGGLWDDRAHRLLGRAMTFLHDHALLLRDDFPASDDTRLREQVERVRITLQPLGIEEMSKLWTTFQTNYRLSVAYQVSVLLLESERPIRTPLPVLTIGRDNSGVQAAPNMLAPLPTLLGIELPPWTSEPLGGLLPDQRPSVLLGDTLTLRGLNLIGTNPEVVFSHPRLSQPIRRAPVAGASGRLWRVLVPNAPADWPAGSYSVALELTSDSQRRRTNALPFTLAPRIVSRSPASSNSADFNLTIECAPAVRAGQQVTLAFGSRELRPNTFAAPATSLVFAVEDATPGVYPLRLQVDAAESLLVQVTGTPPAPSFDPNQMVEVLP